MKKIGIRRRMKKIGIRRRIRRRMKKIRRIGIRMKKIRRRIGIRIGIGEG